jgi:hypothetical protein
LESGQSIDARTCWTRIKQIVTCSAFVVVGAAVYPKNWHGASTSLASLWLVLALSARTAEQGNLSRIRDPFRCAELHQGYGPTLDVRGIAADFLSNPIPNGVGSDPNVSGCQATNGVVEKFVLCRIRRGSVAGRIEHGLLYSPAIGNDPADRCRNQEMRKSGIQIKAEDRMYFYSTRSNPTT